MTYELAKQLGEAGFPQTDRGRTVWSYDAPVVNGEVTDWAVRAYEPTLSELIEALGDDFDLLTYDRNRSMRGNAFLQNKWWATSWSRKEAGGDTPEIAVARLWLALNKKP